MTLALPSSSGRARLTVRDLSHHYGPRAALVGLGFHVDAGEMVGLLGPNGSGKSTALALLAGLQPSPAGRVAWAEASGESHPGGSVGYRARLGVVFQRPSLDRALTAEQNLQLAAQMQGIPRRLARSRARDLLAWAGLEDRARDLVRTYSGGMQRRLEIARALVHEPSFMLLDEPTSGLDAASFERTWELLSRLRAEHGVALVVATHRPEEGALCDRLVVLDEGRVVREAAPDDLIAELADDVVTLVGTDPDGLAREVEAAFGLPTRVDRATGAVHIECTRGHELVVRLVERLPAGRLEAVSLRRPGLADAFLKLTGRALAADPPKEAA